MSDYLCEQCGVNPCYGPICGACQAEEDFYNCEFCHGESCTGECEEEEEAAR